MSDSSSAPPQISKERNNTGIPVTCSKCNDLFESDLEYVIHYNEVHAYGDMG